MDDPIDGPRSPGERIASIDALRGFALCGILFINIFQMGGPIAMERPLAPPSLAHADWIVWATAQLFATGTMRGLFSLLFGVGLLIFVGDDESARRSNLYLRRMLILFLFGVIDCTVLLWPGDILLTYALAGVIMLMMHPLKATGQLAAAGAILIPLSAWAAYDAHMITPAQTVYTAEMLAREGTARLGSYWQTFDFMSYVSWSWTVNALTYRWIADAAVMMLIGMALYREGLFGPDAKRITLLRIAVLGYAVGLVLRLAHVALVFGNDGGPTLVSALIDQPGRVAMTLGHFALFQLLWRAFDARFLKEQLACMGRMALTLYLGQSLMAAFVFSGFGLGLWNRLSWPALWLVAPAILLVQWLFANWWFERHRYGPVEWLWRWGTYGARPGFRL